MPPINAPNYRFIELLTVDSTNNYAMGLVHAGMSQHGTVVYAHEQTKGKGQRQKKWLSKAGENIMLSLIINPFGLQLDQQFLLSMSTAIGVQNFFSTYAGDDTKIKWPNDIYWCDRKAGGILIENIVKEKRWSHAIIGIGININQTNFTEIDSKAVSLKQITGKQFDTIALAKELTAFLEQAFQQLVSNPNGVLTSYENLLYKKGEKVRLKKGTRVFETTIKGVQPDGQLVTGHSIEELFSFGEIEWLIR